LVKRQKQQKLYTGPVTEIGPTAKEKWKKNIVYDDLLCEKRPFAYASMIEHNLESSNSYIVVKAGNDGKLVRAPSSLLFFFFQGSKRS